MYHEQRLTSVAGAPPSPQEMALWFEDYFLTRGDTEIGPLPPMTQARLDRIGIDLLHIVERAWENSDETTALVYFACGFDDDTILAMTGMTTEEIFACFVKEPTTIPDAQSTEVPLRRSRVESLRTENQNDVKTITDAQLWRSRSVLATKALTRVQDTEPSDWTEQALCSQTDPEVFFPEKGQSTNEAKRVCSTCDVQNECLDFAMERDERFGVWGGLSERERRALKRSSRGRQEHLSMQFYQHHDQRIRQVLDFLDLSSSEREIFTTQQPKFAQLVYSLLMEVFPEEDDNTDEREWLEGYFLETKKPGEVKSSKWFIKDSLEEFFERLGRAKHDFDGSERQLESGFAEACIKRFFANQTSNSLGVSRYIPKRSARGNDL